MVDKITEQGNKEKEEYILNLWEWGFWTLFSIANVFMTYINNLAAQKICVVLIVAILSVSDLFLPDLDDSGISSYHRDTLLEKFVKRLQKSIRLATVGVVTYLAFL